MRLCKSCCNHNSDEDDDHCREKEVTLLLSLNDDDDEDEDEVATTNGLLMVVLQRRLFVQPLLRVSSSVIVNDMNEAVSLTGDKDRPMQFLWLKATYESR